MPLMWVMAWVGFGVAPEAWSELWLPSVFTDHAVLQRDQPVPVWGRATPGQSVSVTFGDQTLEALADAEGRWRVELAPMSSSAEARTLVIASGQQHRRVRDVLVGEVWLCGGQSNMDWKVRNASGKRALLDTADEYPQVRLLRSGQAGDFRWRDDVDGRWRVSGDDATETFSAVGYAFARELHDRLGVPVGILQASIGGTRIETWTPRSAMRGVPMLGPDRVWLARADREYAARERAGVDAMTAWLTSAEATAKHSPDADVPDPPAWPRHEAAGWNRPAAFFNGMVAGLSPYRIRGIVWYQGESNKGEADLYAARLEAMLRGWRAAWGRPELPALIVELPPYADTSGKYPSNALPWLVDAQQRVSRRPHNFGVVINDLGNVRDIHPRNKRGVAERLADTAMAEVYGRPDEAGPPPIVSAVDFRGGEAFVTFSTRTGLATRDGAPPNWFQLAGAGSAFRAAEAAIVSGDTVRLRNDAVAEPWAVRFAFDESAEPNLVDGLGRPAAAFRTDDTPEPFVTQQRVTLPLWPQGAPLKHASLLKETTIDRRVRGVSRPTVELFFPRGYGVNTGDDRARPTVLIFPGGGYGYLTIEKEGKAVARRLNDAGFVAGVVKYRAAPHAAPVPWLDAAQAVRSVRTHADELGLDPERVGVLGFSAGGHVAACVSVLADDSGFAVGPESGFSSRPDFTVLVYPVVSMRDGVTHGGSRKNLLGPEPDAEAVDAWSAELNVDEHTPPTFLVHCANDGVSIRNSELYVAALEEHGVPHVFALYDVGGHGFGLADPDHPAGDWSGRVVAWIEALFEHDADAPRNGERSDG